MHIIKKYICFSLIFVFISSLFFPPIISHAIETPDYTAEGNEQKWDFIYGEGQWEVDPNTGWAVPKETASEKFTNFIMGGVGMSGKFGALTALAGKALVKDIIKDGVNDIIVENGSVKIGKNLWGNLYNALANNVYQMNGYFILTSNTTKFAIKNGIYFNGPQSSKFYSWVDNAECLASTSGVNYYSFNRNGYFYIKDSWLYHVSRDFSPINDITNFTITESGQQHGYYENQVWIRNFTTRDLKYCGLPLKIFNSDIALNDYFNSLSGNINPSIFLGSKFYNYSPKDISIDINTYKNNDYTQINQNTYNNIINERNSVIQSNGGSISEGLLQKVIDDALKKIEDSLGNIEDNTGDIGQDTTAIVSILNKIKDVLDNIYDAVHVSFLDTIIEFIKAKLADIGDLIEGIVSSTIGNLLPELIKFFIGDGGITDAVLTPAKALASKAQSKFPTCIPWDIIAIIKTFSAEPVVPKFELPFNIERFGINETIVIDFKKADSLAKVSRSMFIVTFLLFLVIQTRHLYSATSSK